MRQILDFNENWWFIHADVDVSEARPGEGELVSLPHTWNALDGQKGDGTYDRAKIPTNRLSHVLLTFLLQKE